MISKRQPCESAGCDSTTSEFEFHSAPVPSTQTERTMQTSHFPIEHSDAALTKFSTGPDIDGFSTVDPKVVALDRLPSSEEKKPDTTFYESLRPQTFSAPPAYSDLATNLGSNNVQNYGAAALQTGVPRRAAAMSQLSSVFHLPASILGQQTLFQLSLRLDPEMLPSSNWKIMAECMMFDNWEIKKFEREKMPTMTVIKVWSHSGEHTIGELVSIINDELDRGDVITDVPDLILKDAARHEKTLRRNASSGSHLSSYASSNSPMHAHSPGSFSIQPPGQSFQASSNSPMHAHSPGSFSIQSFQSQNSWSSTSLQEYEEKPAVLNTSKPVPIVEVPRSAPEPTYDAFVLCNMADKKFVVNDFLTKVEDEAKLKLCLADRDIPPGNLAFVEQMDYMFQRSRKLVVILSDDFFQSREHDWQSNLAISQDPASRTQRIIPVKYKKMNNRNIFDHLGCCDLTKTMKEEWFWQKIINGIKQK